MINRTKLSEALERYEVATSETFEGVSGTFIAPLTLDDALVIFETASEYLTLMPDEDGNHSDEQVELVRGAVLKDGWYISRIAAIDVLDAITGNTE